MDFYSPDSVVFNFNYISGNGIWPKFIQHKAPIKGGNITLKVVRYSKPHTIFRSGHFVTKSMLYIACGLPGCTLVIYKNPTRPTIQHDSGTYMRGNVG